LRKGEREMIIAMGSDCEVATFLFRQQKPNQMKVGDASLDRPWSKYSTGSSAFLKRQPEAAPEQPKKRIKTEEDNKPSATATAAPVDRNSKEFKQFLAAAKPKSAIKLWADDETGAESGGGQKNKKNSRETKEEKKTTTKKTTVEGVGKVKVIESEVVVRKAGVAAQRTHMIFESDDENSDDEYQDLIPRGQKEEEEEEEDMEDMEESEEEKGETAEEKVEREEQERREAEKKRKEEAEEEEQRRKEQVDAGETGRLFVRNLAFSATEEDLRKHFTRYGELEEVHIPIDKSTKRPIGVAFLKFVLPQDAVRALNELDGTIYQGRLLHVLPARPNKSNNPGTQPKNFKEQREQQRKEQSNNSDAWNSLFLRSDTVAEAMAEQFGVDKGDVLDREGGDSMAVRLALGETRIIADTKILFEQEGVDLKVLQGVTQKQQQGGKKSNGGATTRSNTTMLVKNLPYSTTSEELRKLFGRFGGMGRLVLAPSRAIGLIEFLEPNEAKVAFKTLAYTKFKHLPLYLEWAPTAIFSTPPSVSYERVKEETESELEEVEDKPTTAAVAEDENEESAETSTIFVKNLSFDTGEVALREVFKKYSPRSLTIAKKKDLKAKGKEGGGVVRSLGYGFVEFKSKREAVEAMKSLQGTMLDGHAIELKFSQRPTNPTDSKRKSTNNKKPPSNKLLIKNVPFQATPRELRDLFGFVAPSIPSSFFSFYSIYSFVIHHLLYVLQNVWSASKSPCTEEVRWFLSRFCVCGVSYQTRSQERPRGPAKYPSLRPSPCLGFVSFFLYFSQPALHFPHTCEFLCQTTRLKHHHKKCCKTRLGVSMIFSLKTEQKDYLKRKNELASER
jgi:multiple RNA-binding domain-containing protein 1